MDSSIDLSKLSSEFESVVNRYSSDSVAELSNKLDVNLSAKNGYNLLIKKLIGANNSEMLNQIDGLNNLVLKTIRLDKYNQIKESISLPVFSYIDIAQEFWETSKLRNYFFNTIFAFVVFSSDGRNQYLNNIIIWKMPNYVLEEGVKQVWEKMHDSLICGQVVKYIDNSGRYFSYFPSSSESPYIHVRPHAQNRQDTLPLPVTDRLTGVNEYPKHSFWISRNYILKIIRKDNI